MIHDFREFVIPEDLECSNPCRYGRHVNHRGDETCQCITVVCLVCLGITGKGVLLGC